MMMLPRISFLYEGCCRTRRSGISGNLRIFHGVALCLAFVFGAHKSFSQSEVLMTPRSYVASFASAEIKVDGIADESAWNNAAFSEDYIDIEGAKEPRFQTRMKMLWDDQYLYVYAEMEEPHVWATLKQRDTVIFYNNDFEVFIDPDGDTHEYFEFEMNALNTVWELLLVKPYRNNGSVLDNWDYKGLQSAVHIRGSLNDASDIDSGWNVEIAFPWSALEEAAGSPVPPEGGFWRMNFSRVNWDFDLDQGRYSRKKDENGKFLPEYNWVWSPQQVVNMHEPERWGYVYFQSRNGSEEFSIPEEEALKWNLYSVYRELLDKDHMLLKEVQQNKRPVPGLIFNDKPVAVDLEFHQSGWNLICRSPISRNLMIINQDGKFTLKQQ